jgi:hypothetical protein
MLENVPKWVKKYGKDTSFYATNDAHTEPLIRQVVEFGGTFVEASLPSPLLGYPRRARHRPQGRAGQLPRDHEEGRSGGRRQGRKGPPGHLVVFLPVQRHGRPDAARHERHRRQIEDDRHEGHLQGLRKYTPGAKWGGSYYVDGSTGVKVNNFVMLLQDTYIFGKGYIHSADVDVPEKYLKISSGLKKKAKAKPDAARVAAARPLAAFICSAEGHNESSSTHSEPARHRQGLLRQPRAGRRLLRCGAGRNHRPGGRERGGQIHAHEDPFRHAGNRETGGFEGSIVSPARKCTSRIPSTPWTPASAWCTRSSR